MIMLQGPPGESGESAENFGIPPEFLSGGRMRQRRSIQDEAQAVAGGGGGRKRQSKPVRRRGDPDDMERRRGDPGNSDSDLPPMSPELENVVERIFDEIDDLREDMAEIRVPSGTKENPARTCKDIRISQEDAADGKMEDNKTKQDTNQTGIINPLARKGSKYSGPSVIRLPYLPRNCGHI